MIRFYQKIKQFVKLFSYLFFLCYNIPMKNKTMTSKKEQYLHSLKNAIDLIVCPICMSDLNIQDNSLVCKNKHTFNINKKGYVRLLKKEKKYSDNIYTKQLFLSRRNIINNRYYDDLHMTISKIINNYFSEKHLDILEIGCGEATHSVKIKKNLDFQTNYIATDLSTDAIELATDYDNILTPILSDLYFLPIHEKSINCIIDILSPFYNKELSRILKKDGIIIKVIPTKDYLKEIRDITNNADYLIENNVLSNFENYYKILQTYNYEKQFELNDNDSLDFFKMTPLTNNKSYKPIRTITISLKIIVATLK